MDDTEKLYSITIILDIILLSILYLNHLLLFDKLWIYSVLLTHLLFFIALKENKRDVLDILHVFIFIFPVVSIFANNIFIKLVSISLLIVIQILWVYENRCILNEKDNNSFGYGNGLNTFLIIFTPILAFNIGYKLSQNSMIKLEYLTEKNALKKELQRHIN
tara:strand:- start:6902 stop:7387 length:486 start_codon:yes stop_codon:yes gene_type:complete